MEKPKFLAKIRGLLKRGSEAPQSVQHVDDPDSAPLGKTTASDNKNEAPRNISQGSLLGAGLSASASCAETVGTSEDPPETSDVNGSKQFRPISELWDEAYEDLAQSQARLVEEYESICLGGGSFTRRTRTDRHEHLHEIVANKTKEIEDGTWKFTFAGQDFAVKDLIKPVVGIVDWAKDYIGGALEPSPPASIAWAGICVLLPLLLNPAHQEASRVEGLEDIASLVSQCSMREALYRRRYELRRAGNSQVDFEGSHAAYRDSLKALYTAILSFQATCAIYLFKNPWKQYARDVTKWDAWDDMLEGIRKQDSTMKAMDERWRDQRYEEDLEEQKKQHLENVGKIGAIEAEVARFRNAVVENNQRFWDKNLEYDRHKLQEWLTTVQPSVYYNRGRDRARKKDGTSTAGNWLVNGHDFHDWLGPNSFIWLYGKAGAGKSILSSSVIHHLAEECKTDPYKALAYFYFDFDNSNTHSRASMLKSMIKNLFAHRPDVPKAFEELQRFCTTKEEPSLERLEAALRATAEDFSDVFLVIDALDECPRTGDEREKLLELIQRMRAWNLPSLHIFATSRQESDIQQVFARSSHLPSSFTINLDTYRDDVENDMETFIAQKLESRDWPDETKHQVRATLLEKADGMFQYVQVQLERLYKESSPYGVGEALKQLPVGLDATYERALLVLSPDNRERAIRALNWLAFSSAHSSDSLTVGELSEAVNIEPTPGETLSMSTVWETAADMLTAWTPFNKEKRFYRPTAILDLLPGFITVEDDDFVRPSNTSGRSDDAYDFGLNDLRKVRLSHFSVKEYLMSDRIKQSPAKEFGLSESAGRILVAESCLLYHMYVSEVESKLERRKTLMRKVFYLWKRAATTALDYVEAIPREEWPASLERLLHLVLDQNGDSFRYMAGVDEVHTWVVEWNLRPDGLGSPIYYTISKQLPHLSSFVLESGISDVNALGGKFGTALNVACYLGDERAVSFLIENGADPYLGRIGQASPYSCALAAALRGEDETIITTFLRMPGVFKRCEEVRYWPLVDQAGPWYNPRVLELLLEYGADVNSHEDGGVSALVRSLSPDTTASTEFFIRHGANVNERCGEYGNALQYAAAFLMGDAAKVLLLNGAKVDAPGTNWEDLLESIAAKYFDGRGQTRRLRDFQAILGERSRIGGLNEQEVRDDIEYFVELSYWRESKYWRAYDAIAPWIPRGRPEPEEYDDDW